MGSRYSVVARTARSVVPASPRRLTSAEPIMTASAYSETAAACCAVRMPKPTATGRSMAARTRSTSEPRAAVSRVARSEERRVGKEDRDRRSQYHLKKVRVKNDDVYE